MNVQNIQLTEFQKVVLYILSFAKDNSKDYITKFQLHKFLYIIDYESRKFLGEPLIREFEFQKKKNGPVAKGHLFNQIDVLIENDLVKFNREYNPEYGHDRHEYSIGSNSIDTELSAEKKMFINSVLGDWINARQNKLREFVYATEPIIKCVQVEDSKNSLEKALYHSFNTINMDSVTLDEDILSYGTNF